MTAAANRGAEAGPHTHVQLHWYGGMRFKAATANAEMSIESGDQRTNFSPMEALLSAVAGCMASDVVEILAKMRTPLTSYNLRCEGWRAESDPRRFVRIRLTHQVLGVDLDETRVHRAVDLSHNKYCSAMASLDSEISIENVIKFRD